MKSRRSLLPIFFLFLFLAIGIVAFSGTSAGNAVTGFFEQIALPFQKGLFTNVKKSSHDTTPEAKVREENVKLQTLLAQQEDLKKENNALRDQFKTTAIVSTQLVPAQIIGGKNDEIIFDKGSADGIHVGNIFMSKDNLLGRVVKVSAYRSVGELLTKSTSSFTAKTAKTSALGIIKGQEEGNLLLTNVVLADKLEVNDLVVTKGDLDQKGSGFPPDLVVGKIIAVNKKNSALFQSAEVEPLVDFAKMEMVFVKTN